MSIERLEQIAARAAAQLPDDARMDAYYYGFDRTGSGIIDGILSAVAVAGKGSHHTESWCEESDYGYYTNRPGLPDATSAIDLIQKSAAAAADVVAELLALVREQSAQIERVEKVLTEKYRLWAIACGNTCSKDILGVDHDAIADETAVLIRAALSGEGQK